MINRIQILVIFTLWNTTSFSQILDFSSNLDNLKINETTTSETKNLLGQADSSGIREISYGINRTRVDSVFYYNSLGLELYFKDFKKLSDVRLNSDSKVPVNSTIRLLESKRQDIIDMFGKPLYNSENSNALYYEPYDIDSLQYWLVFGINNENELVQIYYRALASETSLIDSMKLERAQRGFELLAKYCPSGHQIVGRVKQSKRDFLISGYDVSISIDPTFESWFTKDGIYGVLENISTAVHESVHALDYLKSYGLLEREKNIKIENLGYYQGIYIKSNKFYLMEIKCTIPSNVIHGQLPQEFENSNRYKKYIFPATSSGGTQVYGIYGLLDEWNAYYHGLRTSLDLNTFVMKELDQNEQNWSFFYANFYSTFSAYFEFKIYILEYLLYLRNNEKKFYKKILKSEHFKNAFLSIQKNYDGLLKDFSQFKRENFEHLKKNNIDVTENDTELKIGGLSIQLRTQNNLKYSTYLSNVKFKDILSALEK